MHKTALITGSARRIGAAIARKLHAQEFNVVIHYLNSKKEAIELCDELNAIRPQSAMSLRADLTLLKDMEQLIQNSTDFWSRLDVLVNNASVFYKTHLEKTTEIQWEKMFSSNLKAPFFLAQYAASFLKKQNGCIVNVADIHAEQAMKDYSVYCMTKAAIVMLTKALAKELSPEVRVNAVAPGPVEWPEAENTLDVLMQQKLIDRTFLKRKGSAEDIAEAVFFLVKDASYITGQVLRVAGF